MIGVTPEWGSQSLAMGMFPPVRKPIDVVQKRAYGGGAGIRSVRVKLKSALLSQLADEETVSKLVP